MQVGLQLRTKQQQRLTPQLQEAIRLMPLSSMALRTEIELFAESNPLLAVEEVLDENGEVDEAFFKPIIASTQFQRASAGTEQTDDFWDQETSDSSHEETLHEKLTAQLNQCVWSCKDEIIGIAIIDAINTDGYLQQNCDEIASILGAQGIEVTQLEVEAILVKIQSFEPSGVGARDLSECLLLQLKQYPIQDLYMVNAAKIVECYLDLLLDRNIKKLCRALGLSEEVCAQSVRVIQSLNSRPGAQFTAVEQTYAVPDVVTVKVQGEWRIQVNEFLLPRLKINTDYLRLLANVTGTAAEYKRKTLKEAKRFIKSIEMRQQTLILVAQKILDYQEGFLEQGPIALRPMTLQIMADELRLNESTLSRITTQKFILTPHGLFEFKYFFTSQVETENGLGISSTAIRTAIQRLIQQEDRARPLSDNALAAILKSQGVIIARRTVMKYREALGILSSVERRA